MPGGTDRLKRKNNVTHQSKQDKKDAASVKVLKKLGSKEDAQKILDEWSNYRQSQNLGGIQKTEADSFLRGIIISKKLTRREVASLFKIGSGRYNRLMRYDPTKPIPPKAPPVHAASPDDKEFVRLFMKAFPMEPGFPCQHRSQPLYMEDPNITFSHMYTRYSTDCDDLGRRKLSYNLFRELIKWLYPTLKLGRTTTDVCNTCYSIDLQLQAPDISPQEKLELRASKEVHLSDAIVQRKAIRSLILEVKAAKGPADPPLEEEPIYIPEIHTDPFVRANRPFVVSQGDSGYEQDDSVVSEDSLDEVFEPSSPHGQVAVEIPDVQEENSGQKTDYRKVKISIQDYGSTIPLPRYGGSRPNSDYFNSNLSIFNMNFVDPTTGVCDIGLYDERVAGKDGNAVCSLRWKMLVYQLNLLSPSSLPQYECKVMDNCVGQNKSQQTMKFSALLSLLLFPDGVTDVFFKVGHSHNSSDQKTAHAKSALDKKNIFTLRHMQDEMNKIQNIRAHLIEGRDSVFKDWRCFLDRHFQNMPPGFTSYHVFEFVQGRVKYKDLAVDGDGVTVYEKSLCLDPVATRKAILKELFNLNATSTVSEILKASPRLPQLAERQLSASKIKSIKEKYQQIPQAHRWYYPEGRSCVNEAHQDLRQRVRDLAEEENTSADAGPSNAARKRPIGRSKRNMAPDGTPSVMQFFMSAPKKNPGGDKKNRERKFSENEDNPAEVINSSDESDNQIIVEINDDGDAKKNVEEDDDRHAKPYTVEADNVEISDNTNDFGNMSEGEKDYLGKMCEGLVYNVLSEEDKSGNEEDSDTDKQEETTASVIKKRKLVINVGQQHTITKDF